MKLGIDRLIEDPQLRKPLAGRRVALLGHPASVSSRFHHSLDEIASLNDLRLTAAFGPQHGMRGEKQDNMMESQDYLDPHYQIPVFSLYGEVRRPTQAMMDSFDVLLVDLQDLGTRIYTFLTTLGYVLEACATHKKTVWILDRPNPAGRPVEGSLLRPGWESFVGLGPLPMRHGMTLGEAAQWYVDLKKLDVELRVVPMLDYSLSTAPGFGWPERELSWVNPSPNAPNLSMARCYPGSVLLEGTTLSEGRGTTRPLELLGAPDLNGHELLKRMTTFAPQWLKGCLVREVFFQPTFHKHKDQLCSGIQVHVDTHAYRHEEFKPYRLFALAFKAIRQLRPNYPLWRDFHYEYEKDRLAIDLIAGGTALREWVDDTQSTAQDLDHHLTPDEAQWREVVNKYALYRD